MKNILFIYLIFSSLQSFSQEKTFHQLKQEKNDFFDKRKKEWAENIAKDSTNSKQKKDGEYHHYKRWEWWAERHLDNNGFIANEFDLTKKAIESFKNEKRNGKIDANQSIGGNWENLSIGNYSTAINQQGGIGRVNCIVEIPNTANVLIGTAGGGAWRGINNGNGYNWENITQNIPTLGVADIVINPANANEIYILTGEGYGGGYPSIGILKTVDGGANWQKTGLEFLPSNKIRLYKIIASPTNFHRMLVVSNNGVYSTFNGWDNFNKPAFYTDGGLGKTNKILFDIKFKPTDPNIIYASDSTRVFKSIDGGNVFDNIFRIPNGTNNDLCQRIMLGVTAANANVVYALAGNSNPGAPNANMNTGFLGLFKSTEDGANFIRMSNSPAIMGNNTDGSNGAFYTVPEYAMCLDVSPTDENRLIMGSLNTWESPDGGLNWTNRSNNGAGFGDTKYVHADIHFIKFGKYQNVLCGNDGGYFDLNLTNYNWKFYSQDVNCTQFYKINIGNQFNQFGYSGRVIYGGSQDNGQHRWQVGSFTKVVGGDGMDNAITSPIGASVVACFQNGGLQYSGNYGATFNTPAFPPAENGQGHWVTPIVRHSAIAETVYAGYKNYYASYDGGSQWLGLVTTGFPNVIHAMGQGIYSTFGQPNTNVVYCGTDINTNSMAGPNFKLYRFENDNAATKTDITGPFNNNFITSIAVDPTNARYVFVTLSGYDAPNKVFFSTDRGATWTNLTSNLPNLAIYSIVLKNGGGTGIYIGTDIGVFHRFSWGGAEKWTLYSNNLPNVAVTDLEIDVANNELYAGTYGRGIWRSDLYTICSPTLTHSSWSVGQEYYEVSNTINSSAVITGGFGSKVTYNAGQEIVLGEGFTITDGSVMNAYIAGCGQVRPDEQFLRKSAEKELVKTPVAPNKEVKTQNKKQ
jgi:hypothetical protein